MQLVRGGEEKFRNKRVREEEKKEERLNKEKKFGHVVDKGKKDKG